MSTVYNLHSAVILKCSLSLGGTDKSCVVFLFLWGHKVFTLDVHFNQAMCTGTTSYTKHRSPEPTQKTEVTNPYKEIKPETH